MRLRVVLYLSLMAAIVSQALSCTSDQFQGTGAENEPPTAWLSSAPPEGSVSAYILHLFWGGWDPDGEISHFEYVITNNESGVFDPADTVGNWQAIHGNDSSFTFTADVFADTTNPNWRDNLSDEFEFRRSHTFFLRSVDDIGARSPVVYRSFTSRTLSPTVFVELPRATGLNAAQVPPISTFRWTGKDFVGSEAQQQEPDWSRFILVSTRLFNEDWDKTLDYIRKNPDADEWSEWVAYNAPEEAGRKYTTPPLDFGPYLFAVQVMDEAGAVNPVFNLQTNTRRILVSSRKTGPLLTVENDYLDAIVTSSPNHPLTFLDLPAGVPMQFCWRANASSYGGSVSGYRYGWDMIDLNDPDQWETSLTPFVGTEACSKPRTFFFGTHTFYVEVVDNSGFTSRVGIRINIVPFTMGREVLVIDDWIEGPASQTGWARTKGLTPTDAEHDLFWRTILSEVEGFNPAIDMIEVGPGLALQTVPINKLADYKTIIWAGQGLHSAQSSSAIAQVIKWRDPDDVTTTGRSQPNVLALFMAAGGRVMVAGGEIMTTVINRKTFGNLVPVYPFMFRYEIKADQDGVYTPQEVGKWGHGDNSFAYRECCLNVLDVAYAIAMTLVRRPPNQRKPPGRGCPVDEIRDHHLVNSVTDGLRGATPIDQMYNFPALEMRYEVAGDPSLFYAKTGMNTDIYNPPYFDQRTACGGVGGPAELTPPRSCFQPIYGLRCQNTNSAIFGAPIAFWTSVHAARVPDVGGLPARSCVFGFHPVYMDPTVFAETMRIVLFDEWQLPRVVSN